MSATLTKQLRGLIGTTNNVDEASRTTATHAKTGKSGQTTKRTRIVMNPVARGIGKRKQELVAPKKTPKSLKPTKSTIQADKIQKRQAARKRALAYYLESSKESEALLQEKEAVSLPTRKTNQPSFSRNYQQSRNPQRSRAYKVQTRKAINLQINSISQATTGQSWQQLLANFPKTAHTTAMRPSDPPPNAKGTTFSTLDLHPP